MDCLMCGVLFIYGCTHGCVVFGSKFGYKKIYISEDFALGNLFMIAILSVW